MSYIFAGIYGGSNRVNKLDPSDMSTVDYVYGGSIIALTVLEQYVYSGGALKKVYKYDAETLTKQDESADLGDFIYSLATDGTYIYAGAGYKVFKLDPSDMSTALESADFGATIRSLAGLGDYIYVALYQLHKVYKLRLSDLVKVGESDDYGSNLEAVITAGGYIYCSGAGGKVWKLNTSLVKVDESADLGSIIALTYLDGYIYGAGYIPEIVFKLDPTDMSTVDQSADFGTTIRSLAGLGDYVYAGLQDIYKVYKIRVSDMVKVLESADLSYFVRAVVAYTPGVAAVTTQAVTDIVSTTATGNGNVTDLGESNVTQHGHCWNTAETPTTSDDKTENGAAATTGAFTSSLTGLTIGTLYFVRAYATNTGGTSYGGEVNFRAGAPGSGEGAGIYAVVEERFHYVDAYGVERYIEGTIV